VVAHLIERGQAPGLYLARQWNNVLFDFLLLKLGNLFGPAAAQNLVVPLCVRAIDFGSLSCARRWTQKGFWSVFRNGKRCSRLLIGVEFPENLWIPTEVLFQSVDSVLIVGVV